MKCNVPMTLNSFSWWLAIQEIRGQCKFKTDFWRDLHVRDVGHTIVSLMEVEILANLLEHDSTVRSWNLATRYKRGKTNLMFSKTQILVSDSLNPSIICQNSSWLVLGWLTPRFQHSLHGIWADCGTTKDVEFVIIVRNEGDPFWKLVVGHVESTLLEAWWGNSVPGCRLQYQILKFPTWICTRGVHASRLPLDHPQATRPPSVVTA